MKRLGWFCLVLGLLQTGSLLGQELRATITAGLRIRQGLPCPTSPLR